MGYRERARALTSAMTAASCRLMPGSSPPALTATTTFFPMYDAFLAYASAVFAILSLLFSNLRPIMRTGPHAEREAAAGERAGGTPTW